MAKTNSRFAFAEKEDAYKQLLFMKKRQLIHLQRDLEFVKAFLRFNKDNGFSDLKGRNDNLFVPNTEDLVLEHYVFD